MRFTLNNCWCLIGFNRIRWDEETDGGDNSETKGGARESNQVIWRKNEGFGCSNSGIKVSNYKMNEIKWFLKI